MSRAWRCRSMAGIRLSRWGQRADGDGGLVCEIGSRFGGEVAFGLGSREAILRVVFDSRDSDMQLHSYQRYCASPNRPKDG